MSKNSKETPEKFVSGFAPYPSSGQFPILPRANYWENGNFMMPGVSEPLMASNLLLRFPQLAALFGGRDPRQGDDSGGAPMPYGFPPSAGQNPEPSRPQAPTSPFQKR